MKRVLLFGGSGFLGRALFKELHPFMDVYGTFCNQTKFESNKRYYHYDFREDSPLKILRKIKPDIIISCLRGDAEEQFITHDLIIDFSTKHESKLIFYHLPMSLTVFGITPVMNTIRLIQKVPMVFLKSKSKTR